MMQGIYKIIDIPRGYISRVVRGIAKYARGYTFSKIGEKS
jgi:hypothetical protein